MEGTAQAGNLFFSSASLIHSFSFLSGYLSMVVLLDEARITASPGVIMPQKGKTLKNIWGCTDADR